MHVFLLPLGGDRFDLYCEVVTDASADVADDRSQPGWWGRQRARFSRMLADAEAERAREADGAPDTRPKEASGIARWVVRKIAEAITELRLLWHLRRSTAGVLVHPHRLDGSRALDVAHAIFAKDSRKHRRWCAVDAVIAAVTGAVFFFVPGPNLIGWYFAFRSWGHFRAYQGAARALDGLSRLRPSVKAPGTAVLSWELEPSPHVSAVEDALALPSADRRARLVEIEQALGLEKLAAFVARVGRRRR